MTKKESRAWLFFLSSNNYYVSLLIGAYKNLLDTKTKYPVYCGVTSAVADSTIKQLNTIGIKTIHLNDDYIKASVLSEIKKNTAQHYITAFTKLLLFSDDVAEYFDKVVYLDTDLRIFENIDDLFELPHMSAVQDRAPGAVDRETNYILGCSRFCSGLFVWDFKNNQHKGQEILDNLPTLSKQIVWHDQNVLNFFYQNWMQDTELHIDPTYCLMNFKSNLDKIKNPKVLHFVGRLRSGWPFNYIVNIKPQQWKNTQLFFKDWVKNIESATTYFNKEYNTSFIVPKSDNLHIVTEEEYRSARADGRPDAYLYF